MFDRFFSRPLSVLSQGPCLEGLTEGGVDVPTVDVYEEGNNIVVKAEVPGISKEDIEVTFQENFLTISGEKKREDRE